MGYTIYPAWYYSHKLDSEQIKEYVMSGKDAFESELLLYLIHSENREIPKQYLIDHLEKGDIKLLFKFNNWNKADEMQDITFAAVTKKICVVYNPIERDSCIVFLLPYLRHFADCLLYTKNNEKYYLALKGARENSSQELWSCVTDVYVGEESLGAELLGKDFKQNKDTNNGSLKVLLQQPFSNYDSFSNFICKMWDVLTGLDCEYGAQTGKGPTEKRPAPYTDPRVYYEEELLDLVYGGFCAYAKKNVRKKNITVNFCDKSELEISSISGAEEKLYDEDGFYYIEKRAEGEIEFVDEKTGKRERDKCVMKFKISPYYEIKKCEIERMRYARGRLPWERSFYETEKSQVWDYAFNKKFFRIILPMLMVFPACFVLMIVATWTDIDRLGRMLIFLLSLLFLGSIGYFVGKYIDHDVRNKYKSVGLGLVMIVILITFFVINADGGHSSNRDNDNDTTIMDTFEKDPNDWTEREKENVNDFFDWQEDYYEDN